MDEKIVFHAFGPHCHGNTAHVKSHRFSRTREAAQKGIPYQALPPYNPRLFGRIIYNTTN